MESDGDLAMGQSVPTAPWIIEDAYQSDEEDHVDVPNRGACHAGDERLLGGLVVGHCNVAELVHESKIFNEELPENVVDVVDVVGLNLKALPRRLIGLI